MSVKKKIKELKTIKCFFDVALVALLLFIVSFLFLSVWDVTQGGKNVVGFALIKGTDADTLFRK